MAKPITTYYITKSGKTHRLMESEVFNFDEKYYYAELECDGETERVNYYRKRDNRLCFMSERMCGN